VLLVAVAVAKLISSMLVSLDPWPVQSLQAPSACLPPSHGEVEDIVLMRPCVRDFQWLYLSLSFCIAVLCLPFTVFGQASQSDTTIPCTVFDQTRPVVRLLPSTWGIPWKRGRQSLGAKNLYPQTENTHY
jgi:hypothetical protein